MMAKMKKQTFKKSLTKNAAQTSQKLASVIFIALMLCSIFAGAVSAESISEDLSDNTILNETDRFSNYDAPNSSDNHSLSSEIDTLLNNKPVFLFFYTDWCHFCQQQKPIIDELEQEYANKIAFIRVNAEENPQAIDEFGVTGFPAMFLVVDNDEGGYVYQGFEGFTDKEVLKDGLEYVLKTENSFEGFYCSSLQFNQTEIGNISTFNQGNSSVDCHCKFLWFWCQKCYSTKAEAVSHVKAHVEPKACFVWKDGPSGHQWRPIPGWGCAHWVAHQLGIKRGVKCHAGYSINIADVISGRKKVDMKCCEVGDVWTTEDKGHCGVVRKVNKKGALVEDCSSRHGGTPGGAGGVGKIWRYTGYCWTTRKLCEDKSTRKICRGNTVVTQEYDVCEWVDKSETKCPEDYKCVENRIDECKSNAQCKKIDDPDVPPDNDNPDENYDVSTPKITSNSTFNPETTEVAVLFKGFPLSPQKLLASFNEPTVFVDAAFSPDLMNDYPVLIIPSGGLYGLDSLPSFKSNLEQYVSNGGTLIILSQQHGYEYSVLPGGNLGGFGWLEDQSCHHSSVYIDTYHPILSGQDSVTSDVTVDGYFTKYPENATILLSRTKNGMPAMLMYEYGNGTVIASTIYTDWAYTHYQATQDGKNLARDMIAWAKDGNGKEISEYGRSDTVNISVNATNIYLPTLTAVEYPQFEPGDVVNIPINITNYGNITLDNVSFSVFDPDYELDHVNVSVDIPPNESKIVDFIYETTDTSKSGFYSFLYSLYAGGIVIEEDFEGVFLLGVNISNLSKYKVNFTLTDPDKKIAKQENISVYVPPGEVKAVNFTYANPPTLGIWNLEYEIFDYNNTFIDSGTEKFAVSKYAENPDGFVYHGKDITFTVSSPEEQYAYGSDVPFTIHIYNHRDVDRSISFSTCYKDWMLSTKLPEQNVEGSLDVPAGGEASFTHTLHVGDIYLSHNQLIIYASFYEDGSNLGRTEKVVWMFRPSVSVHVETDQKEYAKGEDVSVLLNLTNKRSAACNATVTVRTLDPDNNKVFEDTFNANLSAYESLTKTLGFTLSTTSEYGTYIVTVEAYSNGNKIGSGSTYFEVLKDYIVKVNFDKPDKAYRIRENMYIDLEVTNIGSALWSSIINISIPDLAFEDSKFVSLNPNETEKFSYNLNISETTPAGKHDVIVTIGFDNSAKQYYFVIPDSNLVLSSEKTSYNAGEYLYFNLTNIGGVDTTCNCSIKFYDSRRFNIYENSTQQSISAGGTKTIAFKIPEQAVNGKYYLIVECKDLSIDKTTRLSKSYTISGLQASLVTSTDKKVYFKGDLIKAFTNITNLNGLIDNATLNLRVYSSKYLIAPHVSLNYNNLPNRLEINNTFIDAVVVSGSTGTTAMGQSSQTRYKQPAKLESTEQRNISLILPMSDGSIGRFTVGTTGGDPENPYDDYKKLIYGHPNPGTSFTTIRIDGNDYIYGSSEGTFVTLPHFEGTSIVSDWMVENVVITQKLTIIYSSTGNPDALEIKYSILNDAAASKDVGVRVMIDTQLAGNDGAPFTIPDVGNVTKEMDFVGVDIPIYWTTMDSLTSPSVIAHGTLRGVRFDPDRFVIAHWPGIRNTEWDYIVDPDRYVTGDSAIGIWWNPISLSSGQSREVATFYGIGYVSEAGGEIIWENSTSLSIIDKKDVTTNITLNATKKFLLLGTLFSNSSQIIAQNSTSFYITDKNTSMTLETDKAVYKPNENVRICGEVTNYANISKDYNLSIKVNGEEIFSDSFSLDQDQSHTFTINTSQNNSFILEGEVDGITITDFIKIEYPSVNVNIITPDVVGLSAFDIGILIENIGNIAVDLGVSINSTWNVTIPEGESRLLETTMNITKNTTLNVTISGDVNRIIQKEIICGENARINVTPQNIYSEGLVEIPLTIENIGILDTEFNATFSIDDQSITKAFSVPKDQTINDTLSFNLTKGSYTLRYSSPVEEGNVSFNVAMPKFVVTSVPANMTFNLGENVTMTFGVRNIGTAEDVAELKLTIPGIYEDTNSTWIKSGEEENISFYFIMPDDLEEKSYKAFYEVNGEGGEFPFFVQGANITVNASLDNTLYEENDTAVLTLNVENNRNMNLSLFSRVKFNEYENVTQFNLTGLGSKILTFNVPVKFGGDNKMLYTVYTDSGRALYINSIYIYEKNPAPSGIDLHTDKQVYNIGEKVTVFVEVTRTDNLTMIAPNFSVNTTIGVPTTFEFTLPELRSGTYYIEYTFGNFSSAYPFDVIGYSVRILEASLDKEEYRDGDTMKLKMNIEANRNVSGLLRTWIYDPEGNLLDDFETNITLIKGENEIEVSRILSTNISGIHVIVYGFYTDLSGHSITLLASGAEYFDAEVGCVPVSLITGWNTISLPLQPADLSASSVLSTIPNTAGNMLYIWNASKNAYDAVYGAMELELGRAYWIPITADGTWMSCGTEIHDVQVGLIPGWNMIGVPCAANVSATDISITVGANTYNLLDAANNGYIGGIFYSWNVASGKWDATVIISPDAKLKPGIGYFANVNQECTITYP